MQILVKGSFEGWKSWLGQDAGNVCCLDSRSSKGYASIQGVSQELWRRRRMMFRLGMSFAQPQVFEKLF